MLFLGYSSNDRYTVAESILFHLKHYGFTVWYDFYDMFLGDNRIEKNFHVGIGESDYLIFIISPSFFDSACAIEELTYAKGLWEKNSVTIFPIFYNYTPNNLPKEFEWVRQIIYNEITLESGTLFAANQIVERILNDTVIQLPLPTIKDVSCAILTHDQYLGRLLQICDQLDSRNYGIKLGVLYSAVQYIGKTFDVPFESAMSYIVQRGFLCDCGDHLSYSIFEKSALIYFNHYLSSQ